MLTFHYGVMSCGKTVDLLIRAHQADINGKLILVMKPKIDTRFQNDLITSRIGCSRHADVLISTCDDLQLDYTNISDIFIDETQFLNIAVIDRLREIATLINIHCYGLRTDFQKKLFPASQRLFEISDYIIHHEIPCCKCKNIAIYNLRHQGKVRVDHGETILLGDEQKYASVCNTCYTRWNEL